MNVSSRRHVLMGIAAIGVTTAAIAGVAALEAIPPWEAAHRAHRAAEARFAALAPDLEDRDPAAHAAEERLLMQTWDAMVAAQPTTWQDYVAKFAAIGEESGICALTDEQAGILLADARRLLERGA